MKQMNGRFLTIEPMNAEDTRNGCCHLVISYYFAETPFGEMLVASTPKGVCYLAFVIQGRAAVMGELKQLFPRAVYEQRADELQRKAVAALAMNEEKLETVPLHLKGTTFQLSVWNELLNIPLGGVTSYGKIAAVLQRPKAYRAVGTAVGDNPVSVLIPCHRVLRTDGALGGYHWGLERKIQLLEWEKLYAK